MNATLFAISIKVVFDNLKLSIPYSLREKDARGQYFYSALLVNDSELTFFKVIGNSNSFANLTFQIQFQLLLIYF